MARLPQHQAVLVDALKCDPSSVKEVNSVPLEVYFPLARQAETKQGGTLPLSDTHVVLQCMLGPINQNVKTWDKNVDNTTMAGVQISLATFNDKAKVAPGLHDCIRFHLEQLKVPNKDIDVLRFLVPLTSYDSGFRKVFAICQQRGSEPLQVSRHGLDYSLLDQHKLSQADARLCMPPCSLCPGFVSICFHPLLPS